jgi:hypothetical protein
MSDWELERGLASSLGFDHDRLGDPYELLAELFKR